VPKKPMQWAIYASEFHTRGVPSPGRPLQELQRASADSAFFHCASASMLYVIRCFTSLFHSMCQCCCYWWLTAQRCYVHFLMKLRFWYRMIARAFSRLWTKCEILIHYRNDEKWL